MYFPKLALASLAASLLYAAAAEDVLTLTESNFKETIANNEHVLVEFYAPWCGHCKKLAPEYELAATALKAQEIKVVLAKVDATAEDALAKEFGVKGFPTLKWFVNGEVSDYSGGRDEKTILSWINKKTGPAALDVQDAAGVQALKAQADAVVLGIFDSKDSEEAKTFIKLAQKDDETPYGWCVGSCEEVAKEAQISTSEKIVVLQSFDSGKSIFSGDATNFEELEKFVSGNLLRLIIPFSQKLAPKIFGGNVKNHLLIFGADESSLSEISKKLFAVAEDNRGEVLFVTVPASESRIVDFFGVKADDMPTLRMVNMGGEGGVKKYKYTESEIDESSVAKFVKSYFAGDLKLDLKSEEPIPESEQGPVYVLTGKDFDQVVDAKGKDVLVEFYAPWCGHCKKLEPEYNAVGEHFKDNSNIVIAKMDATANEVERVQISGFPTLKFFPADSEEIVEYSGARDKAGIIKFLEENAKSLKN